MIELSRNGRIARLTVRRAEKKNAFTSAMWQSLLDHCRALQAELAAGRETAPRVLQLAGQPGVFCAGADIEEMQRLLLDFAAMAQNNEVVLQAQLALENLPLPTLALIDGPCFGGGFGIAAACDFRLVSSRSLFAITPARLGLLYSLEDTRRVVALVGQTRARRLLLRSERLDAAQAAAWGVADAVVEADALEALAQRWSEELAAQSPTSMAGLKLTLAHLGGNPAVSQAQVRAAFVDAFSGADCAEGTAAFLQRRPPRF